MFPSSARNRHTGPGSRGGAGHTTAERLRLTPAYWRDWRASHPEYRIREAERMRVKRLQRQLVLDRAYVDDLR